MAVSSRDGVLRRIQPTVITFHPAPPGKDKDKKAQRRYRMVLLLLAAMLLLPNISHTSNPGQGDEVMHIATVQDSLASGSILYPELNGFINFYKPPLLFWLAMGTERLTEFLPLDTGLLGERIISALASAGAALFLFQILLLYRKPARYAFFWAALYLSSLGVIKFARLLMFEQLVAFHIMATVYVFALWLMQRKDYWLVALGLLVGSSYLYKGPLIPIYMVLGLLSWAAMEFYRTAGRFSWNMNFRAALPVLRTGLVVCFSAILPVAAYLAYLLNHPNGDELITYFVVFENAAKFVDQNQSEMVLFRGIALYLLPWTLLLAGVFNGWRKRDGNGLRTPATQFASLMAITFLAITLFHIIPNRKADYYMLPLFGLLFVAAGLRSTSPSTRPTNGLVAALSFLGSAAALYMSSYLAAGILIGLAGFAAIGAWKETGFNWKGLGPGIAFSALLPWTLFPSLFPETLDRADQVRLRNQEVCVLSENPWSALSYKGLIKESDMIQRHPDLASECDNRRFIIEHDEAKIPAGYREVSRYPVWKDLTLDQYLADWREPQRLQRSRIIYEKD